MAVKVKSRGGEGRGGEGRRERERNEMWCSSETTHECIQSVSDF